MASDPVRQLNLALHKGQYVCHVKNRIELEWEGILVGSRQTIVEAFNCLAQSGEFGSVSRGGSLQGVFVFHSEA